MYAVLAGHLWARGEPLLHPPRACQASVGGDVAAGGGGAADDGEGGGDAADDGKAKVYFANAPVSGMVPSSPSQSHWFAALRPEFCSLVP